MLTDLVDEVIAEAKRMGFPCVKIDAASAVNKVIQLYAADAPYNGAPKQQLWDHFSDSVGIQGQTDLLLIDHFLQTRPLERTILVVQDVSGMTACCFDRPSDVVPVLFECAGFVFYVTNETTGYVLCLNDHDFLIGVGLAKDWLSSLSFNNQD